MFTSARWWPEKYTIIYICRKLKKGSCRPLVRQAGSHKLPAYISHLNTGWSSKHERFNICHRHAIRWVIHYTLLPLRPCCDVVWRLSVFQGDGRMSVAQILFSFAPGTDCGYGHVKCVRVNQGFRGMGLGPLLFKEVSGAVVYNTLWMTCFELLWWTTTCAVLFSSYTWNCSRNLVLYVLPWDRTDVRWDCSLSCFLLFHDLGSRLLVTTRLHNYSKGIKADMFLIDVAVCGERLCAVSLLLASMRCWERWYIILEGWQAGVVFFLFRACPHAICCCYCMRFCPCYLLFCSFFVLLR